MPLSAATGVECRNGGGDHTLVVFFNDTVISGQALVTSGIGSVAGSLVFNSNTMTVELTGVTDVQKITVTFSFDQTPPDVSVSMNTLIGDTNGNKTVNANDIGQTKSQSGSAATSVNFRVDVNASGTITASDIAQVKASAGHTLP